MNADYIKQRIDKIRNLISEARYDEAFEDLEKFIAEIEGDKVESIRERDLLDQLISVKSRYNFFKQQVIKGIQEGQTELNQIASALLTLTNQVKEIGDENPEVFKPAEKEYFAEMAASPPLTANQNIKDTAQDGSQNSGCLLAINNKNANVNVEIKDFNWSAFFLKMLIGIALIGGLIFYLIYNYGGCNTKNPVVPPPDPIDTVIDPNIGVDPPPKLARGKGCKELGLTAGKMCDLADYLSDPDNKLSKKFELDQVAFKRNSLGLTNDSKARQQINDLVKLLNEYPTLDVTVYGYFFLEGENGTIKIKGVDNKEVSLDNVRARKIYNRLLEKGIEKSRLDYVGDTENDAGNSNVWIRVE